MSGSLGNKEIMASNIKRHIDKLGMTVKDFAMTLDFKYTTVLDWVNAKTYPRIDKIEIMANYFGVEKSDLVEFYTPTEAPSELVTAITDKVVQLHPDRQESVLGYASDQLEAQKQEETNKVIDLTPYTDENYIEEDTDYISDYIQGIVSAGPGSYQEDDLYMEVKLPASEVPDQYDTIAKVVGDSMKPIIEDSDLLFIEVVSQVDPNTIGIFQVNGKNYVKKFRHDQNGIPYLQSLNPDSDDIFLNESDDIRTIGEVVEIYREG